MEISSKKIGTLEQLLRKGVGKFYFHSSHREVIVDEDFAKEFCRKYGLQQSGEFSIHRHEGKHYIIFYHECTCEGPLGKSWRDQSFQVCQV